MKDAAWPSDQQPHSEQHPGFSLPKRAFPALPLLPPDDVDGESPMGRIRRLELVHEKLVDLRPLGVLEIVPPSGRLERSSG